MIPFSTFLQLAAVTVLKTACRSHEFW